MAGSYIPSRESVLVTWAINFDTLITAAPATYGLVAADATSIHSYVAAFSAAYTLASDAVTRTLGTVADKDAKKAAMLDVLRSYAQRIKLNAGVADMDKVNLGLNLDSTTATPIPPPSTYPLQSLSVPVPLQIECRISDSSTPDSAAKPFGAIGAQVFVNTLANPPTDPTTWKFAGFATRSTFRLVFDGVDSGKVASIIMRWQNRKGETGPCSQTQGMTIVGT